MASSIGFNHVALTVHISILFESTCSTTSPVLFLTDWEFTVHTFTCPSPGLSSSVSSWFTWINDNFWEVLRRFECVGGFLLPVITGTVFSLSLRISSLFTSSDLFWETPHHSECVGGYLWFVTITGVMSCFGAHVLLWKSAPQLAWTTVWKLSKDFRNSPGYWKWCDVSVLTFSFEFLGGGCEPEKFADELTNNSSFETALNFRPLKWSSLIHVCKAVLIYCCFKHIYFSTIGRSYRNYFTPLVRGKIWNDMKIIYC